MLSYQLTKKAILETFEDRGLVLILPDRHLVDLNSSAVAIVNLLDGKRTTKQVALEISKKNDLSHDYPINQIIQDVLEL